MQYLSCWHHNIRNRHSQSMLSMPSTNFLLSHEHEFEAKSTKNIKYPIINISNIFVYILTKRRNKKNMKINALKYWKFAGATSLDM